MIKILSVQDAIYVIKTWQKESDGLPRIHYYCV